MTSTATSSTGRADNETALRDNPPAESQPQTVTPHPDLRSLDRLVGVWEVAGEAQGRVTYTWMAGGFFLMQQVQLEHEGHQTRGLEIIGHLQRYGEAPSPEIWSRYYGSTGETFDYVYEVAGDTLTIWAGGPGSPAYYRGTFSPDGNTLTGGWVYPDGGGYTTTTTRIT